MSAPSRAPRGTLRAPAWRALVLVLVAIGAAPHAVTGDVAVASPPPPIGEIVYGGDASFPPYEFLDADGQPAGLNVELIRAVADAQRLKLTVRLLPWKEVRAGLAGGSIDVAAMYRTPARAMEVDYAIAHEIVYHEMYVRRGAPPLRSLADLDGKRVLVEGGTVSADTLSAMGLGDGLVPCASEPAALEALARGEGDVAIVTQAVNRPFEERTGILREVGPSGPPVLLAEYAFVTRKGRPDLLERLNMGVAAVKESGDYDRMYRRWIRPDRSTALARVVGWALLGALTAVIGVVLWNRALRRQVAQQTQALRREYDERLAAQTALSESERSLRSAQKMEAVGRLAGGVAHDFNNMLSVVLSYGGALREELAARGLSTADVDEILSASERASRLTRQLLAFSRATPVEAIRLDAGAVLSGMRSMVQRLVGEHIALSVRVPDQPVIVEAEATQLEQILLNLAANARDAMPQGGTLTLELASRTLEARNALALPAGRYAAIAVTDSGVGMDPATLGRIFEPFFTTKELGRGTGLGLATVFAHVERLGGKIGVQSAPGAGSRFEVLLPERGGDAGAVAVQAHSAAPPPRLAPQQILLVEDDEAFRRAAARALQRAGHLVLEAGDGEVARRLGTLSPVSILVTDVVMPKRSGPSLAAALRAQAPALLVLYVSGYVQEGERLDLDVPGTAFLAKPCTAGDLVAAVHRLVAQAADGDLATRGALRAAGAPAPPGTPE